MKYAFLLLLIIHNLHLLSQNTLNWLQNNVIPVSTTDQYVDNTSEYEPLKKILEGKDIIMLGEEDHIFSTSLESKTKLIKFLHDEMGFTVLAFENDLYTMAKAYEKAVKENNPTFLRNATWPFWGWSTSTKSLFPYVLSTTNKNPLKIIGFDCQTMSGYPFVDDIHVYLRKTNSPVTKYNYYPAFYEIFEKAYLGASQYGYNLNQNELLLLFTVVDDILFEMDLDKDNSDSFKILKQSLLNFKNNIYSLWLNQSSNYNFLGYPPPNDSLYGFVADRRSMSSQTRRDKLMAENIKWIKEVLYPGEKIIIWAATEHTMYNRHMATFHNMLADSNFIFSSRFRFNKSYKTMGTYVKEDFGAKVYNLGFTTLGGQVDYDRTGNHPSVYTISVVENSLESYFTRLNCKNGILNLLPPEVSDELLNPGLFHNFIGGQPNTSGNISIFFDGIFFIREMEPIQYYRE